MPRFFFDINDSDGLYRDDAGLELENMDVAVGMARQTLSDMVRDAFRDPQTTELSVQIRDGSQGPVVLTVKLETQEEAEDQSR
ncbi:MAG: hypothetical protein K0R85_1635 [Devosia sp.]|jgi:hypothetical protein|nr:hypothetical protein [Devosia sp.]